MNNKLVLLLEHGFVRVNIYEFVSDRDLSLNKSVVIPINYPYILDPLFDYTELVKDIVASVARDHNLNKEKLEYEVIDKKLLPDTYLNNHLDVLYIDFSLVRNFTQKGEEKLLQENQNLSSDENFLKTFSFLNREYKTKLANYFLYPPIHSDDKLLAYLIRYLLLKLCPGDINSKSIVFSGAVMNYCKDDAPIIFSILNLVNKQNIFNIFYDMNNVFFENNYLRCKYPNLNIKTNLLFKEVGTVYNIMGEKKHMSKGEILGTVQIDNREESLTIYPIAGSIMRVPIKYKSTVKFLLNSGYYLEGKRNYIAENESSIIIDTRMGIKQPIIESWYDTIYVNGF